MLNEKDFCDYETCVALKELGYNQYTSLRNYAGKGGVRLWDFDGELNYKEGELITLSDIYDIPRDGKEVAAPSLYEAQKFLREEKKTEVVVLGEKEIGGPYYADIYTESGYAGYVHKPCEKYEEALSEGIKEAVKLLKEK